jgi:rRNA maturation endonuclease Nob1
MTDDELREAERQARADAEAMRVKLEAAEAENVTLREAARRLADAVKDWSECSDPALVDTIIKDVTAAHAHLRTVLGENE